METDEIDAVVAGLRAGRSYRVPFTTTLYPDTQADQNVLRAREDGAFELTTTYREFAPGHGWGTTEHETETRTEAQVRQTLRWAARDEVVATP